MIRLANILVLFLICLLLQACAGSAVAPVTTRAKVKEVAPSTTQRTQSRDAKKTVTDGAGYHIVASGDTLYSIAWNYNFDYKDVAKWNNILEPYTIYPDQFIRLKPPVINVAKKKKGESLKLEQQTRKNSSAKPIPRSSLQIATIPPLAASAGKKTEAPTKKINQKPVVLPRGKIKWFWPTTGKIVKSNSPKSNKGIDISGKIGQGVKAAAAGEVVYSGSGLIGFGKLIIIKHNETYLSAYAYNHALLVKEGDKVHAGQAISKMGKNNTGNNLLHFEIRKNGQPVDPIKYLPKKRV